MDTLPILEVSGPLDTLVRYPVTEGTTVQLLHEALRTASIEVLADAARAAAQTPRTPLRARQLTALHVEIERRLGGVSDRHLFVDLLVKTAGDHLEALAIYFACEL